MGLWLVFGVGQRGGPGGRWGLGDAQQPDDPGLETHGAHDAAAVLGQRDENRAAVQAPCCWIEPQEVRPIRPPAAPQFLEPPRKLSGKEHPRFRLGQLVQSNDDHLGAESASRRAVGQYQIYRICNLIFIK